MTGELQGTALFEDGADDYEGCKLETEGSHGGVVLRFGNGHDEEKADAGKATHGELHMDPETAKELAKALLAAAGAA